MFNLLKLILYNWEIKFVRFKDGKLTEILTQWVSISVVLLAHLAQILLVTKKGEHLETGFTNRNLPPPNPIN